MSFQTVPKVELHTHLEGAAPPDLIRAMAREKHTDLSGIFTEDGGYAYRDFWHFLEVYEAATSVLQSPADFARLTKAVLDKAADAGVIYLETFLSPDFCGGGDVSAWRDYVDAIRDAAGDAERARGITLRGIITAVRHIGPDQARKTALCAQETAGDFITGFGMGGDEKSGQQGDFAYAFDMAREAGLRLTSHAGEWNGPDEIRAALDDLRVERIGHGVRAIEDPALVERLVRDGITLETCPGSNVFLGVYPDLAAHPIARLRDAGVKVTVSTDDPPFFRTDMVKEYDDLSRQFGWTAADFKALNLTAIDAAFCDNTTRARVRKILETQDV